MATAKKTAKKAAKKVAKKAATKPAKPTVKRAVQKAVAKTAAKPEKKVAKKTAKKKAATAASPEARWGKTARELGDIYAADIIARADKGTTFEALNWDFFLIAEKQAYLFQAYGDYFAVEKTLRFNFQRSPYALIVRKNAKPEAITNAEHLGKTIERHHPGKSVLESMALAVLDEPMSAVIGGLSGLFDLIVEKEPHHIQAIVNQHNTDPLRHCPDPGIVMKLISMGARPDATTPYGVAWIHLLVRENACAAVEALLHQGISANTTSHGETLLHACQEVDMAELLLAHGANIEARGRRDRTPVFGVPAHVARFLIERGADLDVADRSGETPLHTAETPEQISLFLEHGCPYVATEEGFYPLHRQVGINFENVKLLLKAYPDSVNTQTIYGETPLHFAAAAKDVATCRELIRRGADVTNPSRRNGSALDIAVAAMKSDHRAYGERDLRYKNAKHLVDTLMIEGAKDIKRAQDEAEHAEQVERDRRYNYWGNSDEELVEIYASDLLARADNGTTVIGLGAGIPFYILSETQKELLPTLAANNPENRKLEALNFKRSRYWVAERRANKAYPIADAEDLVNFLYKTPPEQNPLEETVLRLLHRIELVAQKGLVGLFELISLRNPDEMRSFINLHNRELSHSTNPALIRKMIELGADPNAQDKTQKTSGSTWLHRLAGQDDLHAAEALLRAGASVSATSNSGNTVLHVCSSLEMANLLMSYGADPETKNHDGKSAIDNAKELRDGKNPFFRSRSSKALYGALYKLLTAASKSKNKAFAKG